ncbi:MAG TPA: GYF domain-containing protein [Kofleriaceae bacterium]|nr:GYF domain-containing protein [Kofleriaceae bacterium]
MKFHCDRCKTRYSIADERVRGKILKIRCKNCSAVITVKEGGQVTAPPRTPQEPRGGASAAARMGTGAPTPAARPQAGRAQGGRAASRAGAPAGGGAPASALQGAFHQALREAPSAPSPADSVTSAPATLEAEWYVSVDGEQVGPLTLQQAQQWVVERQVDEELYCWSEGFDDWLPVEKVSHFRGLRTEELPRADFGGDERTVVDSPPGAGSVFDTGDRREETPVPLFAATMAKLEQEAPTAIEEEVKRRFPDPLAARKNGASPAAASASSPAIPRSPASPAARATLPPPKRPSASQPAVAEPEYRGGALLNEPPADSSLDFEIGEASRVVKLPMLARNVGNAGSAAPAARAAGLPGVDGGGLGRGSGSFDQVLGAPAGGGTASLPVIQAGGTVDMPRPELLQPNTPSRRGLLLPIALGGAALAAVVALLLVMALGDDDEADNLRLARGQVGGAGLAYQFEDLDQDGRDDKTGKSESEVVAEAAASKKSSGGGGTTRRVIKRNTSSSTATATTPSSPGAGFDEVDLGGGARDLDPNDLISVYQQNRIGVTLCYNSALKKDPYLSVKKAEVSINVATSGKVNTVSIPSLRGTELGSCLERRIKAWRFPKSTSGLASRFPIIFDS